VARLPGFLETSTTVVVALGQRRVVTVDLRRTAPITQKWWFWTGLGTVVAAGVVATYAAMTERPPGTGSIPPGRTQAPQ
jgi:hypothetical protein